MLLKHKKYGYHQFSKGEIDDAKKEGWEPVEEPAPVVNKPKVVPEKPKGVNSPVR